MKPFNLYVDIDETLFDTPKRTDDMNEIDLLIAYAQSTPNNDNIYRLSTLVNELSDKHGDVIVTIYTSRGNSFTSETHKKTLYDITYQQLVKNCIVFDNLLMEKPAFDMLIDDKAFNLCQEIRNTESLSGLYFYHANGKNQINTKGLSTGEIEKAIDMYSSCLEQDLSTGELTDAIQTTGELTDAIQMYHRLKTTLQDKDMTERI